MTMNMSFGENMALVPASSQACCPCFGQEEHAPYGEYGSPQDGQGARDRLPSYGVGKAQADRYSFFPATPGVLPMLRSRGACPLRRVWLPTRPAVRLRQAAASMTVRQALEISESRIRNWAGRHMEKWSNRSKEIRESRMVCGLEIPKVYVRKKEGDAYDLVSLSTDEDHAGAL